MGCVCVCVENGRVLGATCLLVVLLVGGGALVVDVVAFICISR
jgi:hypothetical protein